MRPLQSEPLASDALWAAALAGAGDAQASADADAELVQAGHVAHALGLSSGKYGPFHRRTARIGAVSSRTSFGLRDGARLRCRVSQSAFVSQAERVKPAHYGLIGQGDLTV